MYKINYKNQYERHMSSISTLEGSILGLESMVDTLKEHLDLQTGHLHNSINHLKSRYKILRDICAK